MKRWATKPLGEVSESVMGQAPPGNESNFDGKGTPFVKAGEFGERRPIIREWTTKPLKYAKSSDVLVCVVGATCGKLNLGADCAIGRSVAAIRPNPSLLNQGFLYAFLQGWTLRLRTGSQGSAQGVITRNMLGNIPIPVPPLAEQERIVKLLDEADELRKLRARADHRTAALLPALFHEMFGDLDSNSRNWSVVRFAEIGEARLGKMLDAKQQTGNHKRPYLRNANVQWDRFDLADVLQMDFSESDREEFRLRYGDLLICEGGIVGRAAIWRNELPECYFQKALHRVRVQPTKALPEFVLWLLKAIAATNGFRDCVGSATIPHLTGVKLASIRIPLPPLPLQKEFAQRVAEIREMEAAQAGSRQRIESLFQSMLHRAFNGEL